MLEGDLFGDETMAHLNDPMPLQLIQDVKCNSFNTSPLSPNRNIFNTPLNNTHKSYPNVPPQNNASTPNYAHLHSQPVPNNPVVQNVQVKNVSLPVQNPTTVIISSPNLQHNTQPLVYTSLPVENQHILLQQGNATTTSTNGHKNGPVILQNIQQPVLLQAKIITSDSQVSKLDLINK